MIFRALTLTSLLALSLPACATPSPSQAENIVGIDLGPSSRVPRTQIAMAGVGRSVVRSDARPVPAAQPVHENPSNPRTTGTVNAVDPAAHRINVSHQPIPAIGWPAMTMDFPVAPSVDLSSLRPGSRINFSIEKGKGGMYQIETIQPAGE